MSPRWPYRLYPNRSGAKATLPAGASAADSPDAPAVVTSGTVGPQRRRVKIARVAPDDPLRKEKISPWVERLSWLLDEAIEIPGTGRRVGFDGLIGFIPVIGDSASLVASFSVVVAALAAGVSTPTVARMVLHIVIDEVFGAVPFLGRLWDFTYKANTRNLALFRSDVDDREATRRSSTRVLVMSVAIAVLLIVLAVALIALNIALLVWLFSKLAS